MEKLMRIDLISSRPRAGSQISSRSDTLAGAIFLTVIAVIPLIMYRAPAAGRGGSPVLAGCLVLLGGLALRIVVIFGSQV